jgi:hypothetical protein
VILSILLVRLVSFYGAVEIVVAFSRCDLG